MERERVGWEDPGLRVRIANAEAESEPDIGE
jgi:hypothetical protein